MGLRDELEQMLRFEISEIPEVRQAFNQQGLVDIPIDRVVFVLQSRLDALTQAVLRLADEVDPPSGG